MDFCGFDEAWKTLNSLGVVKLEECSDELLCAGLDDHDELIIFDLLGTTQNADSISFPIREEKAADALEAILHSLHLTPLLLFRSDDGARSSKGSASNWRRTRMAGDRFSRDHRTQHP